MTRIAGWDDDVPYIAGEAREALEDLVSEQGLSSPDQWDSYDVYMDAGDDSIRAMITTNDGGEFEIEQHGIEWENWTTLDEFDWVWEIWDWVVENYPEVDTDSHYE